MNLFAVEWQTQILHIDTHTASIEDANVDNDNGADDEKSQKQTIHRSKRWKSFETKEEGRDGGSSNDIK